MIDFCPIHVVGGGRYGQQEYGWRTHEVQPGVMREAGWSAWWHALEPEVSPAGGPQSGLEADSTKGLRDTWTMDVGTKNTWG